MRKINHEQLKLIIKKAYKAKVSLDVNGHPGIGKSQVVIQTAKKIAKENNLIFFNWNKDDKNSIDIATIDKYFFFADIRLHQMDPTGLLGIPDVSGETVEWKPIKLFKTLSNKNVKGILFFDEANLAQESVLASAYSIIQNSEIGDLHISDDVMKITAGNLPEDGCNVTIEPAALNNRRMNYVLDEPSVNNWIKWASNNDIDARVVGFVQWDNSMLFKFDEKISDKAFPSPRTWEYTSDMIKGETDIKTIELFASGLVGEEASGRFAAYLRTKVKIDIKKLLENPDLFNKLDNEIAIKYIIISSLVDGYKNNRTQKYFDQCSYLALKFEDELLVYMIRQMKFRYGQGVVKNISKTKNIALIRIMGENIL